MKYIIYFLIWMIGWGLVTYNTNIWVSLGISAMIGTVVFYNQE